MWYEDECQMEGWTVRVKSLSRQSWLSKVNWGMSITIFWHFVSNKNIADSPTNPQQLMTEKTSEDAIRMTKAVYENGWMKFSRNVILIGSHL